VILQRYREALELFPLLEIGKRSSYATERLLSLRLAVGGRITGRDVLTLCGAKVTAFGREHLVEIAQYLDAQLDMAWRQEGINHLADWARDSPQYPYQVFNGTPYGYFMSKLVELKALGFSNNPRVARVVSALTREAENVVRQEMQIPRVGEGWVAETILYYAIKQALPQYDVLHHATPSWLGRQHLDIYIPELRVAIEYQGLQHDEPVEYFGGAEAFEQTKKRDAKKKRACTRNGIRLICVRPDYDLNALVAELREQ